VHFSYPHRFGRVVYKRQFTGGVRTVQVTILFFGRVSPIGFEPCRNRALVFSSSLAQFEHGWRCRKNSYSCGITVDLYVGHRATLCSFPLLINRGLLSIWGRERVV
ncbi:unnamed protein product, partial [Ectocarpus sp. 8 AP-2014]